MGLALKHRFVSMGAWLPRAVVGLGLCCVGCAEELHPVALPTAHVEGVVRIGNKPVSGGWVEITPIEGTIGNLRTAPIGPDGHFAADKVAVGKNSIGIMNAPIERGYLVRFHPFNQAPIVRTIAEGHPNRFEIDLLQEMLRRP